MNGHGRQGVHRQLWFATAVVLAALVILVWVAKSATTGTPNPCREDMKCWDCATMGNKRCGP